MASKPVSGLDSARSSSNSCSPSTPKTASRLLGRVHNHRVLLHTSLLNFQFRYLSSIGAPPLLRRTLKTPRLAIVAFFFFKIFHELPSIDYL
ncbi:hypothetical protein Syun_016597 [Stephania yunnanensis]|uniref:Uncharacterized protein n=1 Tax=Stephania yunnanensis TaxID=152371 RepID=A0AAP0J6Z9_9MAGN